MKISADDHTAQAIAAHAVPHWTVETAAADYLIRKTSMAADAGGSDGLWEHVKSACAPAEDTLIAIEPTVTPHAPRGMVHVNKNCAVDAAIDSDGTIHLHTDAAFH